ncbi:MAG: outer membrane beta-barrel protein [candidate division FCPU426 bacterium]
MKKIIVLMGLLALGRQAEAIIGASAFGGYTTLSMASVNSEFSKSEKDDKDNNETTALTPFGSAYYVGAEAGLSLAPFLKAGPRVEYIHGSASYSHTPLLGTANKTTYDAELVPVLLGLSADVALPGTGITLKGGVYGGYGMATLRSTNTNGSTTTNSTSTGANFMGEIAAQVLLRLIPSVHLGLDLGYRMADIAEMKDTKTDTTHKNSNGDNLHFDYSGFNIGAAATLLF